MIQVPISRRHHALYRFYAEDGALLYVGITADLPNRILQHQIGKPWWSQVHHIAVQHFPDRTTALKAETEAIQTERPRYNKQHNYATQSSGLSRSASRFSPSLHLARQVVDRQRTSVSIPLENPQQCWYHRRINVRRIDQRVEVQLNRDGYVDWCQGQNRNASIAPSFLTLAGRATEAGITILRKLGVEDDLELDISPTNTGPLVPRWITLQLVDGYVPDVVAALYEAEILGYVGVLEWITGHLEAAARVLKQRNVPAGSPA